MCWYIAEFLFATETMLMLCMTLKRLWIALHIDPTWGTILWNAFCLNHCFFTRTNGKTWKKCPLIPIRNACCLSWVHLQTLFKLWLLFPHKNSNEKQQLMTSCSRLAFRDNLTFCCTQGCFFYDNRCTGWPKKMRTHILFDKKPIF